MAIRAITFDFWRTLFTDANGEARQRLRADACHRVTGAPYPAIASAFEAAVAAFTRHHIEQQQTLAPHDCVRIVSDHLGVPIADGVADELAEVFATAIVHHSPGPIEGALEAVEAAAGLRPAGIISDSGLSPGRSLRVLLDRHGFTPHFRHVAFSDEVGVAKPQRPMFETTAAALGVQPHELLHIGDLEGTDIAGAHAVGAKAALFAGDNDRYAAETTADYVFHDWYAFIDALPALVEGGPIATR